MTSARKLMHTLCSAAMLLSGAAARAEVVAEIPTMHPGETVEATVSVSNPAEATAMQFIITLPEGFTIPDGKLTLSDRAAGHSTEVNAKGSGEYRCVIYSTSNAPFEGTSGKLFSFGLKAPEPAASGEYPILFSGIRYSDADGKETSGADATCMARIFIPVASITLDKKACNMAIGESLTLTATVAPEGATDRSVTWNVDNAEVATVTQEGKVTALAEGTAVITVTADDGSGASATCIVNVGLPAAESVSVTPTEISLFPGQTTTLSSTVLPAAASQAVNWTSSAPAVATVASDGTVTAVAPGEATITATASDGSGKKAECKVTVMPIKVSSISLDKTEGSLKIGESLSLTATISPEDATDRSVTWSSDNAEVASVTQEGKVTALAEGTAAITVTANDGSGASASCTLTVLPILVSSITLDKEAASLKIGESITLQATVTPGNATDSSLTWESDNTEVATVTQDGTVTALAEGTAVISVMANDGSEAEALCVINVGLPGAESVIVTPTELSLQPGQTSTLSATVLPTEASQAVIWTSSNTAITTVASDGTVTAVAPGEAIITATASDGSGKKAECKVTVQPILVSSITLDLETLELTLGESLILNATVTPEDATDPSVTWSSDNPETVRVNQEGIVTALDLGTAVITVTANDGSGKKAECQVTVRRPTPVAILVTPQEAAIEKDSTLQLTATVVPAEALQEVEWSSNDPETATVTDDGLVTALKEGTALIYVRSKANPHAETYCFLTVTDSNAVQLNPADNLYIEVEGNEMRVIGKDASTIVKVYDMEGRTVLSTKGSEIRGLEHGVYVVSVGNHRIKVKI